MKRKKKLKHEWEVMIQRWTPGYGATLDRGYKGTADLQCWRCGSWLRDVPATFYMRGTIQLHLQGIPTSPDCSVKFISFPVALGTMKLIHAFNDEAKARSDLQRIYLKHTKRGKK